jgi:hypothetical protein
MQLINPIRWLKDVVEAVGGTTPIAVHISFSSMCSKHRFRRDGTRRGHPDGFN